MRLGGGGGEGGGTVSDSILGGGHNTPFLMACAPLAPPALRSLRQIQPVRYVFVVAFVLFCHCELLQLAMFFYNYYHSYQVKTISIRKISKIQSVYHAKRFLYLLVIEVHGVVNKSFDWILFQNVGSLFNKHLPAPLRADQTYLAPIDFRIWIKSNFAK